MFIRLNHIFNSAFQISITQKFINNTLLLIILLIIPLNWNSKGQSRWRKTTRNCAWCYAPKNPVGSQRKKHEHCYPAYKCASGTVVQVYANLHAPLFKPRPNWRIIDVLYWTYINFNEWHDHVDEGLLPIKNVIFAQMNACWC